MNAISTLTVEDPEKARRMLLRLGSLLRRSLDEEQHEVPLEQELGFLLEYLEIQRVRFGDRLVVQVEIDPAATTARVPVLFLQPLVENAIEHGGSDRPGGTSIVVRARRRDGTLQLSVEDDGAGPGTGALPVEGIGLRNTRERLRKLYGDRASLELRSVRPDQPGAGGGGPGSRFRSRSLRLSIPRRPRRLWSDSGRKQSRCHCHCHYQPLTGASQ